MSASMMDTAKLPATSPSAVLAPVEDVCQTDVCQTDVCQTDVCQTDVCETDGERSRIARRRERQQVRRKRRLYATCGLAALASVLGATIYVVDVVR